MQCLVLQEWEFSKLLAIETMCLLVMLFWICHIYHSVGDITKPNWPQEANNMRMFTTFDTVKYIFLKHFDVLQCDEHLRMMFQDFPVLFFSRLNCTSTSFGLFFYHLFNK